MREPNEVDFWRGFALVTIFINHVPGIYFERFTTRNFGLSDSAELFVFLAGWSLRRLADGATERVGLGRLVLRLGARAVTIYAAQILITMLAVAITAVAAILSDNALLLEWNNAAAVFQDPVPTHIGLVLLTHQLGYFNILPLYVVLMMAAPALAVVHRTVPKLVLPLSLVVYAATLAFAFNLPTWPVEGTWFLDPMAWQLVFVLGFTIAGRSAPREWVEAHPLARRLAGFAIVIVGLVVVLSGYSPDPTRVPTPRLFFVFDKTFVTPARLIHFLGVVAAVAGWFVYIRRFARPIARFFSMLGRNSLNVFCVGSLASLTAQLVRFVAEHSFFMDAVILIGGVGLLGFTAWLSELRERLRAGGSGARSLAPALPA